MKKYMLPIISVVIVTATIGGFALSKKNDTDSKNKTTTEAMKKEEVMKTDEKALMAKDEAMKNDEKAAMAKDDTMKKETTAMSKNGSYITLADFNSAKDAQKDNKKVLFFHAPWCPTCKGIDNALNASPDKIPAGTTIIKTDFDSNNDLKKRYGVTYQYTFVQIDNDGNKIKKWSATDVNEVIANIE